MIEKRETLRAASAILLVWLLKGLCVGLGGALAFGIWRALR